MPRQHNSPVTIQVYLGSGKSGARLRANMEKASKGWRSLSEMIVDLLKKSEPALFKGVAKMETDNFTVMALNAMVRTMSQTVDKLAEGIPKELKKEMNPGLIRKMVIQRLMVMFAEQLNKHSSAMMTDPDNATAATDLLSTSMTYVALGDLMVQAPKDDANERPN